MYNDEELIENLCLLIAGWSTNYPLDLNKIYRCNLEVHSII